MRNARDRGERRRVGRVAGAGCVVLVSLMLATMPAVGFTAEAIAGFAALAGPGAVVAAVLCWTLPWDRWPDRALLVVPLGWWIALSAFGLASDGNGSVYAGFNTFLFLFVGLTQRRWTSVPLLVPAVLAQLALYDGWTPQLVARLPIAVVTWVSTAELLSAHRARTSDTVTDLESRAAHDPLTGCWNRAGLAERLAAMQPGDAVVLLDLDHFKALNDSLGHGVGDRVLRDFGALLRRVAREPDRAIRYGGEEFLLLLPGAGSRGAVAVDSRLREAWLRVHAGVTFSAGIAVVGDEAGPTSPGQRALSRADTALYAAKLEGRDRGRAWSPELASMSARTVPPAARQRV